MNVQSLQWIDEFGCNDYCWLEKGTMTAVFADLLFFYIIISLLGKLGLLTSKESPKIHSYLLSCQKGERRPTQGDPWVGWVGDSSGYLWDNVFPPVFLSGSFFITIIAKKIHTLQYLLSPLFFHLSPSIHPKVNLFLLPPLFQSV